MEAILIMGMATLLITSILLVAENASAETWTQIQPNTSCTGVYHKDTRCLISVSDCWGAANHACRQKDQVAKCVEYRSNAYDIWNTSINETQTLYDRTRCLCSYWCMNNTKPTTTSTTSTTQKWIIVATSTTTTQPKPTKPTIQWVTLPKITQTTLYPEVIPQNNSQTVTTPQRVEDQILLWLIILVFLVPAALEDIRTGYIDRRLTVGFTATILTYALITWNTSALTYGTLATLVAYILWRLKHMGTADLLLTPGAITALVLLNPMREEILVATVGTLSYILFYLRKRQWNWKQEIPVAACLLTYYLAILIIRLTLQIQ